MNYCVEIRYGVVFYITNHETAREAFARVVEELVDAEEEVIQWPTSITITATPDSPEMAALREAVESSKRGRLTDNPVMRTMDADERHYALHDGWVL